MEVFVHKPPQKRTVTINGERYFLTIPHVLYVMRYLKSTYDLQPYSLRKLHVFFKSRKIRIETSEKVCRPFLGNCHFNAEICLDKKTKYAAFKRLEDMAAYAIDSYWSSEFNNDLEFVNMNFLRKWQKDTKEKGFFNYEEEYNKYLNSVSDSVIEGDLSLGVINIVKTPFVLELNDESSH